MRYKEAKNESRVNAIEDYLADNVTQFSPKVFATYDQRRYQRVPAFIEGNRRDFPENLVYRSELQHEFNKQHGIDIVFKSSGKNTKMFVIDKESKSVYEGEDVNHLLNYFDFTGEKINIEQFFRANDYTLDSPREKEILLKLYDLPELKSHMIFINEIDKRSSIFKDIQRDVTAYIKNPKNPYIKLVFTEDGKGIAWHGRYHHLQDVKSLVSARTYDIFERSWLKKVSSAWQEEKQRKPTENPKLENKVVNQERINSYFPRR